MSFTRSGFSVEPFHLRPRPAAELTALFAGGWPAFIEADDLAARHLATVRAAFADLEVALLQDGVLAAAGWGVPIAWDGTVEGLPAGYMETLPSAVATHQAKTRPDPLVVCAAQLRPDAGRTGLAATLLEGLIATGRAAGRSR